MASLYPEKRYCGLDWAAASKEIVDAMARRYGWQMTGRVFDFFRPDPRLFIEPESVVFTLGALEQTGANWEPFLDYILQFKPALCVHIEPVVEWYSTSAPDSAAAALHHARGYWSGFFARLLALRAEGRAEILKMKRTGFGSQYIEGYSQIIWRPL